MPRSLLRWREPDHEAQHAVRTDYLAPARFGEVATGFDLRLFGGLQGCAVLGFDALILAALPLAVRTAERDPELVDLARWLHRNVDGRPYSLRDVAGELAGYGHVTPSGKHYSASAVASTLAD